MFEPKFNYTNKIVNNLVAIASAREVILNAFLVPKWEVSIRREALIRASHSSTAIEGNPLTLEEVSQLAQGRKITATRKAKQEVLNYLKVLENINKYQVNQKISEKDILRLHKDIVKGTLDNPEWEGQYRKIQVYVGNKITGEVIFTPPPPVQVPILIKEYLEWLNLKSVELNPVIVAGISHYEFVRIHPFVDGNGRTARALSTLILCIREFDIKRFFTLDDYYDSDRKAYYDALKNVSQKSFDLTNWLEYFTDGVLLSVSKVKEKILQLSIEKRKQKGKGQIALTERQMKIVEFIYNNGKITSSDIQKMFKITRQAVNKEIKKLIMLEVIEKKGVGKKIFYILK
ncbi:MAG: Fic family protein [candidate division WOR-3 bacterium]